MDTPQSLRERAALLRQARLKVSSADGQGYVLSVANLLEARAAEMESREARGATGGLRRRGEEHSYLEAR